MIKIVEINWKENSMQAREFRNWKWSIYNCRLSPLHLKKNERLLRENSRDIFYLDRALRRLQRINDSESGTLLKEDVYRERKVHLDAPIPYVIISHQPRPRLFVNALAWYPLINPYLIHKRTMAKKNIHEKSALQKFMIWPSTVVILGRLLARPIRIFWSNGVEERMSCHSYAARDAYTSWPQ